MNRSRRRSAQPRGRGFLVVCGEISTPRSLFSVTSATLPSRLHHGISDALLMSRSGAMEAAERVRCFKDTISTSRGRLPIPQLSVLGARFSEATCHCAMVSTLHPSRSLEECSHRGSLCAPSRSTHRWASQLLLARRLMTTTFSRHRVDGRSLGCMATIIPTWF